MGAFLQERLELVDNLTFVGGLRYDYVGFEVRDDYLDDGDTSGDRDFDQVTARAGLSYALAPEITPFVNIAQSFETPTLSELVLSSDSQAALDPDLSPQRALATELGARGEIDGNRFRYEATAFVIELEDELLPAEDASGRNFYTNAGKSRRVGAELWASVRIIPALELTASYSWLRSTFENGEYAGNPTPGLPEHRVFAKARYDDGMIFAGVDVEWVAERWANNEATAKAPAHTLASARGGVRVPLGSELTGEIGVGLRNLFDVRYAENVRINAFGSRYFEPGPPLSIYGTFRLIFEPLSDR